MHSSKLNTVARCVLGTGFCAVFTTFVGCDQIRALPLRRPAVPSLGRCARDSAQFVLRAAGDCRTGRISPLPQPQSLAATVVECNNFWCMQKCIRARPSSPRHAFSTQPGSIFCPAAHVHSHVFCMRLCLCMRSGLWHRECELILLMHGKAHVRPQPKDSHAHMLRSRLSTYCCSR